MSGTLDNIEQIEQYVEGKLSRSERDAFESRLLSDPSFKDEFELYKNVVAGIKSAGEENLKNKLKEVDQELDDAAKVVSLGSKQRSLLPFGIAASLAFIIGLTAYWYSTRDNMGSIADKYYVKDKGLPVEMSIDKNRLDELMNKYKIGDYLGSKASLEALLKSDQSNDTLNYYLGLVQYELGEYDSTVGNLNVVSVSSVYHEKSEFYLALACLKLKDKNNAKKLLDGILEKPDHAFFKEATQISKELSSEK